MYNKMDKCQKHNVEWKQQDAEDYVEHNIIYIYILTSLLAYNCFTMVCQYIIFTKLKIRKN